jgi:hypothetical protein
MTYRCGKVEPMLGDAVVFSHGGHDHGAVVTDLSPATRQVKMKIDGWLGEHFYHISNVAFGERKKVSTAPRAVTPEDIWREASEAAQKAAKAADALLPPETARGLDCGFAWVTIKPARGAFVGYAKANRQGYNGHKGGYCIMAPRFHGIATQSISVHEAAARAAAEVLRRHGLNVVTDSRLD